MIMRPFFSSLLFSLTIAACSSGGGSGAYTKSQSPNQAPSNRVEISIGSVVGNGQVVVPVSLQSFGQANASSLQFDLSYDTSRLQLIDARPSAAASAAGKDVSVHNSSNQQKSRVLMFGLDDLDIPAGDIIELVFNAGPATGSSSLSPSKVIGCAGDAALVTTSAVGGSVTIP
jgi:hypothetical protein